MAKRLNKTDVLFLLLLLAVYLTATFLVNPIGEFPLNDDWSYSKNVWHLTEKGEINMSKWPAMTLISQTIMGSIYAKLLGFSFFNLRLSTMVLSFISLVFMYFIFNFLFKNKLYAFLIAVFLYFNPIYFSLTYTFMTDVNFLAYIILSVYFYAKYTGNNKLIYILSSTFFAIIATLLRQPGILLPLCFLITHFIYKRKFDLSFLISIFSFLIVLSALFFYTLWIESRYGLSENFSKISDITNEFNITVFMEKVWLRGLMSLMFYGLFFLPVSIILFYNYWIKSLNNYRYLSLITAIVISFFAFGHRHRFPFENIFYNFGLGVKLLKDYTNSAQLTFMLSESAMFIVRLFSAIGALIFIFILIQIIIAIFKKNYYSHILQFKIFCLIIIIVYSAFLFAGKYFFDRYLLILFPFFLFLFFSEDILLNKKTIVSAIIIQSFFVLFSILATNDYFRWNAQRWNALNNLTDKGISPMIIDGGFEFNGWHSNGELKNNKKCSWWFVNDDIYVVSSAEIKNYDKVSAYPYSSYFGMHNDTIWVYKRK